MIKSLKLVNFRNFLEKEIFFIDKKNMIVWNNWRWKTNILESIALLSDNSINSYEFDSLVKNWEDFFYIETINEKQDKISIYFDKNLKKKKYSINWKSTTKKILWEKSFKSIIFSPIDMNLMYLWPSLRRNFLDSIISNITDNYEKELKIYKNILKNRNIVLKNIFEKKVEKKEIDFWDEKFIESANSIYNYRFKLINYISKYTNDFKTYFSQDIENIKIDYLTKVKENNIKDDIFDYIKKNLNRDIMLWKTYIWPHLDDFDILINEKSIKEYASRWETKSIIIWLKLLEAKYIESKLNIKPIILIDDLLSELDDFHKDLLLSKIENYQTFISSIKEENNDINLIKI